MRRETRETRSTFVLDDPFTLCLASFVQMSSRRDSVAHIHILRLIGDMYPNLPTFVPMCRNDAILKRE